MELHMEVHVELRMELRMELHMELHMEVHMEFHMELHMELHVEVHTGYTQTPIWPDRRGGTYHISLHYNKIETAICIYMQKEKDQLAKVVNDGRASSRNYMTGLYCGIILQDDLGIG